jgi:hypothetical protein
MLRREMARQGPPAQSPLPEATDWPVAPPTDTEDGWEALDTVQDLLVRHQQVAWLDAIICSCRFWSACGLRHGAAASTLKKGAL